MVHREDTGIISKLMECSNDRVLVGLAVVVVQGTICAVLFKASSSGT